MFFGTKLFEYQASFYDLLNLWCFYSITAPHYANNSTSFWTQVDISKSELSFVKLKFLLSFNKPLSQQVESCPNFDKAMTQFYI